MLLFQIISEWSLWWLLLVLPAVFVVVWYFYHKDNSLSEMPKTATTFAKLLRIMVLIFICLLCFGLIFKWNKNQIKKPLIAIAIDQSQSIKLSSKFNEQKEKISAFIKNINLTNNYNIKIFGFGSDVKLLDSLQFEEKATNISNVIHYIHQQFEYENLGAIVLLSDGIYNQGSNPIYLNELASTPIFSVCLGDSVPQADLIIDKINYNSKVFVGNNIKIQVAVKANKLIGKKSKIHLLSDGKTIKSQDIIINKNQFYQTFTFVVNNEKEGIYKYQIKLDPIENESSFINNNGYAIIHVSSDKQKIIIATSFPHPDIGAIKSALETNPSYSVTILSPEKAADSLAGANAVILYQLPSKFNNATTLFKNIFINQTPTLFILGGQSQINALNANMPSPILIPKANQTDDAYPLLNKNENLFNLSSESKEIIESFPPLLVYFGDYKLKPNAEVVAYQKIKQIQTDKPLIIFDYWQENHKYGIIFGEGIYRWRLAEYAQKQQNIVFNEFINKLINYLLLNQKKERFRIINKQIYNELENITFDAELYNKSYEPISDAEINMSITSANNKYTFTFDANNPFYSLNIGRFPAGEYKWTANAQTKSEKFSKSGIFIVKEENIETNNLIADAQLMEQLAIRSGGRMLSLDSLFEISNIIKNQSNILPVSYSEEDFVSLIDFNWILIIIVILISIEWFLRRYFGSL
ncbi:MAG: hypothetical protein ACUVQP_06070 [Bacteroidales bacterium]